jgi:hypothetical protein
MKLSEKLIAVTLSIFFLNAVKNGNPVACALFLFFVVGMGVSCVGFVIAIIYAIITWDFSGNNNQY